MLDRKALSKIFLNAAILLEIKGELPFKTKAYHNISELLSNPEIDFDLHIANNSLKSIPGVGDAISKKIIEFSETGKMEFYEKLIADFPESLVDITNLAKIGVKKTAQIFKDLGIYDIDKLEIACQENKIANLKGFGEKTQENILTSISHTKAAKGRFLQKKIIEESNNLLQSLQKLDIFQKIEIAGEERRSAEILEKIVIVASAVNIEQFDLNCLKQYNPEIFEAGESLYCLKLNYTDLYPILLYITEEEKFYVLLHNLSSSQSYLNSFTEYLNSKKIQISDLILKKDNTIIKINSEEDLFEKVGLAYIPSELRESELGIEKAKANKIPKLIEKNDLKGVLHMHTVWSDGKNTIKEMALKAKELGFEYLGISDHSQTSVYTNGLTPERILKQHKEIDELNNSDLGIHIFKGIESDILLDGSLDYDPEVLELFDFIVASVHSSFTMPKKEMTNRICTALKNPYTMMLGHPTGRLLLSRAGYELDIDAVIETAAEHDKIIELNANPYRLDLSWENIIKAKEKGVKISINPDSHKTSTLSDTFIGVGIARKGWIETNEVLNSLNLIEFSNYIFEFKKRRNK